MNGDVYQWNEALISGSFRSLRGGSYSKESDSFDLSSSFRDFGYPTDEAPGAGFRVAGVLTPEPSTAVLAIIACGVILWWRKRSS